MPEMLKLLCKGYDCLNYGTILYTVPLLSKITHLKKSVSQYNGSSFQAS